MANRHILYGWFGVLFSLPFPIGVVLSNLGFYSTYWPWLLVLTAVSFPLCQVAHMSARKEKDKILEGLATVGISLDFISVLIILGFLFIRSL